jgi:hypothetical protein
MSTTKLTATSQLRDHDTDFETLQLRQGKSTTVFRDLDECVTERMARFITVRHAQGRAERLRSGGQSQGGCGPAGSSDRSYAPGNRAT